MTALELVAQHVPAEWFSTVGGLEGNSAVTAVGHDDYWLYSDNKQVAELNTSLSKTAKNGTITILGFYKL